MDVVGIPATYVQATPDLLMGDLLKNMRSSQIFSVCGLPDATVKKGPQKGTFVVELNGVDIFDPITMKSDSRKGTDVPCWLLDTDYNGLSFHVSQAFFPRTGAWDALKKALRAEFEVPEPILSSPFEEPREHWRIRQHEPAVRERGRRRAVYFYRDPKAAEV